MSSQLHATLLNVIDEVVAEFLPIDEAKQLNLPVTDTMLLNLVGPSPLRAKDFKRLARTPEGHNIIRASILLNEIPQEYLTHVKLYEYLPTDLDELIIQRLLLEYSPDMIFRLILHDHQVHFLMRYPLAVEEMPEILTPKSLDRITRRIFKQHYDIPLNLLMDLAIKVGGTSARHRLMKRALSRRWNGTAIKADVLTVEPVTNQVISSILLSASDAQYDLIPTIMSNFTPSASKALVIQVLLNPEFNPDEMMLYLAPIKLLKKNRFMFEWLANDPDFRQAVDWEKLLTQAEDERKADYIEFFERFV